MKIERKRMRKKKETVWLEGHEPVGQGHQVSWKSENEHPRGFAFGENIFIIL